jgi:aryl-alcohol dehydrogenase-like predicted oxidoreductase
MAAFDALVRQGKVLYVGMSNFASWQVCEALWRCDVRHWSRPVAIQVPYNLIARSLEEECVAFARQHRVAVAVYDPLAGGLLSGKYRVRREPEPGTRFAINPTYHQRYWSDANLQAAAALAEIAAAAGTDLLGLSLRWLLTQAHVDSVILGVSKPQQLAEDLGAVAGRLPQEALDACDAVWAGLRGSHFRYNR